MTKRILFGAAVAAVASFTALGPTAPVHAGQYPPGCAIVTMNDVSVSPSTLITITASGYSSIGAPITFYMIATTDDHSEGAQVIGTAFVQLDGTATITITAPTTVGSYDIIAVGGECEDALSSFTVEVDIPKTGSDSQQAFSTAAALLVIGGGLVLVAFRRRRPSLDEA